MNLDKQAAEVDSGGRDLFRPTRSKIIFAVILDILPLLNPILAYGHHIELYTFLPKFLIIFSSLKSFISYPFSFYGTSSVVELLLLLPS